MNKENKSRGIGFVSLLTIVFVIFKLLGKISWSWFWVFSPIIIEIVFIIFVIIIIFILKMEDKLK